MFPPRSSRSISPADRPADKDVQAIDVESVPKANRLMAEFFGTDRDLGLHYRKHRGAGRPRRHNASKTFATGSRGVGPTLKSGDRLIIYVTAHGDTLRRPQESLRNVDHALER